MTLWWGASQLERWGAHNAGEYPMKHNVMLTIASLLSILFMTFHLTDDIIRGMASGQVSNLFGVLILVVWLYGTLVLAERRSGYVIILLGSLLGLVVPVIHMCDCQVKFPQFLPT